MPKSVSSWLQQITLVIPASTVTVDKPQFINITPALKGSLVLAGKQNSATQHLERKGDSNS